MKHFTSIAKALSLLGILMSLSSPLFGAVNNNRTTIINYKNNNVSIPLVCRTCSQRPCRCVEQPTKLFSSVEQLKAMLHSFDRACKQLEKDIDALTPKPKMSLFSRYIFQRGKANNLEVDFSAIMRNITLCKLEGNEILQSIKAAMTEHHNDNNKCTRFLKKHALVSAYFAKGLEEQLEKLDHLKEFVAYLQEDTIPHSWQQFNELKEQFQEQATNVFKMVGKAAILLVIAYLIDYTMLNGAGLHLIQDTCTIAATFGYNTYALIKQVCLTGSHAGHKVYQRSSEIARLWLDIATYGKGAISNALGNAQQAWVNLGTHASSIKQHAQWLLSNYGVGTWLNRFSPRTAFLSKIVPTT